MKKKNKSRSPSRAAGSSSSDAYGFRSDSDAAAFVHRVQARAHKAKITRRGNAVHVFSGRVQAANEFWESTDLKNRYVIRYDDAVHAGQAHPNRAVGDSSHSTYHFGLSHGGDKSVRTTLRVGDLAFLDTLGAGLIPVRIDRVIRPGHGSVVGDGRVIVVVTAARPGYRLGEKVEAGVDKVVPRTHVRRSGYHLKVDTRYDIR